jgi:Chaperone of endosialidase
MKTNTLSLLFILPLAYVAVSPTAQAQLPPPVPDGCYQLNNTAEGCFALESNTFGGSNTAAGASALRFNTTGGGNTATGKEALSRNTTGDGNTATGSNALTSNTTSSGNTATGASALFNSIGSNNTANGVFALVQNTTGSDNTATGASALRFNTTGNFNTAGGFEALISNTQGRGNVALGAQAGKNATTGDGNVYIGTGMEGVAGEANHTYIRNIKDTTVSGTGTDTVTVNLATGLLGHWSSSRRYKEDIKAMDRASEVLFALKPVTYRYNKEIDPSQSPAFGLIAEEVAEVNPDLVARNPQGQPESVHYEMVNAMLLNEFLKEHRTVQELKTTVVQQQKQIEMLTAGLQKMSAQLEARKPAPQVVNNNQ